MGITNAEWERVDRELEHATVVLQRLADRYGLRLRPDGTHPGRSLIGRRGFWRFHFGPSLDPETVAAPEHRYLLIEARVWHVGGFFQRGYERRVVAEYSVDDLRSDEPLQSTAESVVAAWPIRHRGS